MKGITFGFTVIFLLFLTQAYCQQCHLRELDLCAASLLVFTQSPSEITGTDKDVERQCEAIEEARQCRQNYTDTCATKQQRDLIDFLIQSSNKFAKEFCTQGTQLREDYKKYAKCLGEARASAKRCNSDLQVSLERLTNDNYEDRLPMACCAFNRFASCNEKAVKNKCGQEAVETSRRIIRMSTSRLSDNLCVDYPETDKKCKKLLPASGTQPSNSKANSLLRKIFTTYLGSKD